MRLIYKTNIWRVVRLCLYYKFSLFNINGSYIVKYIRYSCNFFMDTAIHPFLIFFLFYLLFSIDFHIFSDCKPFNNFGSMDDILFWLVPVASVLALCFAYYFHKQMMKEHDRRPCLRGLSRRRRTGGGTGGRPLSAREV